MESSRSLIGGSYKHKKLENSLKKNWKLLAVLGAVLLFIVVAITVILVTHNKEKPQNEAIVDECREAAEKIIEAALGNGDLVWDRLATMVDTFGPRLSGSAALNSAIDWIELTMKEGQYPLDNVHKEPVMVPTWVRGNESARLIYPREKNLAMHGLGGSIGTPAQGIQAEVLVVQSFDELTQNCTKAKNKIVLFNAPFQSYGVTVKYRTGGAVAAAKCGAVAALVRSITPYSLYTPHTGSMYYQDGVTQIPTAAITVEDAETLQRMQDRGVSNITVLLNMEARTLNDTLSYNVMGEITGSELPHEIVVIGGHTDSWDVAPGAMDDGGGVFVSWEAVRLLHSLGLRPRRTIRVVGWVNEENGGRGAIAYANDHRNETHIFAIESDSGVTRPLGLGFVGNETALEVLSAVGTLLADKVNSSAVTMGGGGADVQPLADQGVAVAGLAVDGTKYFWYHHTEADTMDKLDPNEMNLCTATMAVYSYCIANAASNSPLAS